LGVASKASADDLVVDRDSRQVARLGTGGDDDVGGFDDLAVDIDAPAVVLAADELAVAGQQRDLVLLEQALDAACELGDDVVLALDHCRHVDLDALRRDAVHLEAVLRFFVKLGGAQQRLGRNAADVEAGAAEADFALRVVVGFRLDAGRRQAQLRRADRSHITAGAGADYYDIKLFVCHVAILKRRAGGGPGLPALPSW
jgi:hypothetical protein